MPRIKRWFPVSHDINRDPELWDLRTKYGEKILACWLELLSIADRNDGEIPGTLEQIASTVSWHIRTKSKTTLLYINAIMTAQWIHNDNGIRVVNYSKYHRTEERNPVPPRPDRTRPNHKNDSTPPKSDLSVKELVESWNESFKGKLPAVEWPLSVSRHRKAVMRLKEHQRLDFWQRVFDNIGSSEFLMGRNNGTWRATLDFLIANDSNCIKIYEGAYNGKAGYNQQRG